MSLFKQLILLSSLSYSYYLTNLIFLILTLNLLLPPILTPILILLLIITHLLMIGLLRQFNLSFIILNCLNLSLQIVFLWPTLEYLLLLNHHCSSSINSTVHSFSFLFFLLLFYYYQPLYWPQPFRHLLTNSSIFSINGLFFIFYLLVWHLLF